MSYLNPMTHNMLATTNTVITSIGTIPGDGDTLLLPIWSTSWVYPEESQWKKEGHRHLFPSHSSPYYQCENTRFVRPLQQQIILAQDSKSCFDMSSLLIAGGCSS